MKDKKQKELQITCEKDYDGYYDDIIPEDNGIMQSQTDKTVIRKIAAVILAAVLISVLSIFVMKYL